MICNHAHECGSREYEHRNPHPANEFCRDGQCRWSSECRCVPEDKRQLLVDLLVEHFPADTVPEIADRIEDIYKEAV